MMSTFLLAEILAPTESITGYSGSPIARFCINLLPLLFLGLVILIIFWLVRFINNVNKEKRRTRIEIGKVAEEVERLREELKNIKPNTFNDNKN